MLGSLFGVNSSKRITEERKGKLDLFFKYFLSVIGVFMQSLLDCKTDMSYRDESRL